MRYSYYRDELLARCGAPFGRATRPYATTTNIARHDAILTPTQYCGMTSELAKCKASFCLRPRGSRFPSPAVRWCICPHCMWLLPTLVLRCPPCHSISPSTALLARTTYHPLLQAFRGSRPAVRTPPRPPAPPLRQPERDSYVHAPTPMAHIVIVAPDWVWRMSRAIYRRSYAHRRPRTASPSAILAHWPVGSQIFRTRSQSAHDAFRALPSTRSAARCQVD